MNENLGQPVEWKKGQNDLEFFGQLSTKEALKFIRENPDEALYYVGEVLYRQECKKYRNGAEVRPETKILFTVGGREFDDLGCVRDFEGNKIRTKASEKYWKAPELHELVGVISLYIEQDMENEPSVAFSEAEIFAEIADIFYNLIHLQITDSEKQDTWKKWVEHFRQAIGIDILPILEMITVKYHTRMFTNEGRNNFKLEDELILDILIREFDDQDIDFKEMFTKFLNLASLLNKIEFTNRMIDLKNEYRAQLIENEGEPDEADYWFVSQVMNWLSSWLESPDKKTTVEQRLRKEQEADLPSLIKSVLTGDIKKQ